MRLFFFAMLLTSFSSFAATENVDLLCQDEHETYWYEVGISKLSNGNHIATLLFHNRDGKTEVIFKKKAVIANKLLGPTKLYSNGTMHLIVNPVKGDPRRVEASFHGPRPGTDNIGMSCYKNSTLTYP